jgi:mannose-1-phosphate guanylyltransferase
MNAMNGFDAMILCAGLGTRLRPLTDHTAKPAVPLFGRPLVGYGLGLLKAAGFERATINTHWQGEAMRRAAEAEAARLGLALGISHEESILGTGGVFRRARDLHLVDRRHALLVLNGDVLFDLDLARVLHAHRDSGAAATMVLRTMPPGGGYSPVEADEGGRIRRIGSWGTPGAGEGRLFTGVHVLSPRALDLLPEGESGIVESVYGRLLAEGERVQAVMEDGLWLDLGDPAGYLDAHLSLMDRVRPLGPLARAGLVTAPMSGVDPQARIHPSATIDRSVVGAGARVGEGAVLRDCVVWPGATVPAAARHVRTIVLTDGRSVPA